MAGADLERSLSANMAAAQNGDASAYEALLRKCVRVIAMIARAQGVRGDGIDDVVQDTLLTVHRARQTYDPARPFLPWLRAIAQRRAIDALRRDVRRGAKEISDDRAYETHSDPAPPPELALDQTARARRLAEAVATLPDGQRQAVEQLGFHERSLDEAAVLTGRTKGALKVNLHRGLKALRARLAGGSSDDV